MSKNSLNNIYNHSDLLKILAYSKDKYKKAILEKADKNLILAICDIIYNILNGNVYIDTVTKDKLKKHKFLLRKIIQKSPLSKKKKYLQQKGGNILSLIIPTIISTVASLLKK